MDGGLAVIYGVGAVNVPVCRGKNILLLYILKVLSFMSTSLYSITIADKL